jgi:hypothetical protein
MKAARTAVTGMPAVRPTRSADIPHIIALNKRVTGLAKREYWQQAFRHRGAQRVQERSFLVAESREPMSRMLRNLFWQGGR